MHETQGAASIPRCVLPQADKVVLEAVKPQFGNLSSLLDCLDL